MKGFSSLYDATIYKKSYLLEFYINNILTDAFCFSVPVENEEIKFSYRVSEIKTFGGICIDNYGQDSYKISLSGNTINKANKFIYRSMGLPPKYLNGEEEVFYLQKLLEKFSDKSLTENTELVLYDLSKNYIMNVPTGYTKNCYRVFPTDFKISRSKEKPFTFNYSLELIAIDRKKTLNKFQEDLLNGLKSLQKCIEDVEKLYNICGQFFVNANECIQLIRATFEEMTEIFSVVADCVNGFNVSASILNAEPLKIMDSVIEKTTRVIAPTYMSSKFGGPVAFLDSFNELKNSFLSYKNWHSTWKAKIENKTDLETSEAENKTGVSADEQDTSSETVFYNTMANANDANAAAQRSTTSIVVSRDDDGNDTLEVVYGYSIQIWNQSLSLEKLSIQKYGSEKYVYMIARYNNITSEESIKPGDEIRLPNLTPNSQLENNEIYSQKDRVYGADLKIKDGYISTFNGDFDIAEKNENLEQAIITRLTCEAGERIKDITFGIKSNIGDSEIAGNYILSSIEQTLKEEPRIESIENIIFTGKGDVLLIDVYYTDIAGVEHNNKVAV